MHRAATVMMTPKSTSISIIGSPSPFLHRIFGRLFYRSAHHSMLELIVKLLQIRSLHIKPDLNNLPRLDNIVTVGKLGQSF